MSSHPAAEVSPWQPWRMDVLERRDPNRAPRNASGTVPSRRREDDISITLFELAKEEAVQKGFEQGRADGLARGYAEGVAQVRAEQEQTLADELAASVAPIAELAATFRQAIDGLNEHVSRGLVELALEAGHHLAGRALDIKPEHILDDIEDLLEEHPGLSGSPTLYVNIDDLAFVQDHLTDTLTASGWQLRPDIGLARGDCRIATEQREIDATVADRWARLLHAVGHGEH